MFDTRPDTASRIVLLALCVLSLGFGATAAPAGDATRILGPGTVNDPPVIQVLSNRPDGVELEFRLPALAVEDVQAAGETFQALAIPRGGESGEVGRPMLPVFGRLVQIPARAGVQIEATVEESDEYDGMKVLPEQADQGGFAYDLAAYSQDSWGNTLSAKVGSPALLRGVRVVPVTFAPVQYNPAQGRIRVARKMHLSVRFSGENLANVARADTRPIAPSFDRMYRELVVNYDNGGRDVRPGVWLCICPSNTTVVNDLQPLVTWRQRKGLPAVLVTTEVTGASNTSIKNYIQNAYDTWDPPPEYVVLAGDGAGTYEIPTWYESLSGYNGEGDHPYTQLDGADVLSDVNIGRLSFNTTTELETIVAKIVGYESNPYISLDPNWYTRACVVGDPSGSGYSCVQVMQWAKTRLLELGYTQVDTVFGGNFVSQMTAALNQGDTVFSYRGYLGMSGWSNGATFALNNVWKLPFAVISTCGTGSFVGETSISEAFLRAGNPTSPRGGIAATGTATWGTHTRYNNCFIMGVLGGLLYEGRYEVGSAFARGKLEMYLNYSNSPQEAWVTIYSYWQNLMGDPATECWTGFPAPLTVAAATNLPVGTRAVPVTVSEPSGPVADAQVCLWKGNETYAVGRTDAEGQIVLPVNLATAGTLLLTVSKHNYHAAFVSIVVTAPAQYVDYVSTILNDDNIPPSQGNGDGQLNPGETVELTLRLKNWGTQTAPGVTAVLTPADPYGTVTAGTVGFGDIPAGVTLSSGYPFVLSAAPGTPNGRALGFSLDITSGSNHWHSLLTLPVTSAEFRYREHHWLNGGPNGVCDPGETVQLTIALDNIGGLDAVGTTASLVSLSQFVDVPVYQGTYSTIPAGGHGENVFRPFTVHASPDCMNGYVAHMRLIVEFSGGMRDTAMVNLPIGVRQAVDPTGPDAYGYLAYDDTDVAYPEHPAISWVELDPADGGTGTEIVLGDYGDGQDKTRTVDMPFPFTYYGQTYTNVSVCSNGWMAMGQTYLTDYRNWTIPDVAGPSGVIAVFWDDLYQPSGAKAWQKYDAANHRWIVEWSRFVGLDTGYTDTFEAIFYDPAYHPTETGDGMIEFQYAETGNFDGTDGNATVGIEKPDNEDGLLYTYFLDFTPGSTELGGSARAIRFVPKREDLTGAPEAAAPLRFALLPSTRNPIRPGESIRFSLDRTGPARLAVYDVQGKEVRTLVDGRVEAGIHSVRWDGRDTNGAEVPSGIYFYKLGSGVRTAAGKVTLLR